MAGERRRRVQRLVLVLIIITRGNSRLRTGPPLKKRKRGNRHQVGESISIMSSIADNFLEIYSRSNGNLFNPLNGVYPTSSIPLALPDDKKQSDGETNTEKDSDSGLRIEKSNILLLGPTGSGQ